MTFFENLKTYVGFSEESSALLAQFHERAKPHFHAVIDDFYEAIQKDPGAGTAITGGDAQIARLKTTLVRWLDELFTGPHDEAYFERRARIGRMHVQVGLQQHYMFTAMNRIRVALLNIAMAEETDPDTKRRVCAALHQILDLELAVMLETYREDLMTRTLAVERLATIGQLAGGIGHELRNPLGIIESSLFLLRQHLNETADDPKISKHLDRIGGEIARSNKTITDLLNLVQSHPLRKFRVKIADLVVQALQMARPPGDVQIVQNVPDDLSAELDPGQIVQVLANLIDNALKSLASHDGDGRVEIEAAEDAGRLTIRVRDSGSGIAPDVRHRIFEPLFTTRPRGTGIGLALCRKIVEAHGGAIDLEPASPGGGAGFVIAI